jgi:ComF family protein
MSLCHYEGAAKALVWALKYQGRLSLVRFLGEGMTDLVLERLGNDPADAVVPVPLYPTRLRERTFNQAEALAQTLARRLHLPCRTRLLQRLQPTRPQAELDRRERIANVQGAFGVRPDPWVRLSRILLVDDVFTTGATGDSCAKVLKRAGAASVVVVTFAHG